MGAGSSSRSHRLKAKSLSELHPVSNGGVFVRRNVPLTVSLAVGTSPDVDAGGALLLPVNLNPINRPPAAFEELPAATTGGAGSSHRL